MLDKWCRLMMLAIVCSYKLRFPDLPLDELRRRCIAEYNDYYDLVIADKVKKDAAEKKSEGDGDVQVQDSGSSEWPTASPPKPMSAFGSRTVNAHLEKFGRVPIIVSKSNVEGDPMQLLYLFKVSRSEVIYKGINDDMLDIMKTEPFKKCPSAQFGHTFDAPLTEEQLKVCISGVQVAYEAKQCDEKMRAGAENDIVVDQEILTAARTELGRLKELFQKGFKKCSICLGDAAKRDEDRNKEYTNRSTLATHIKSIHMGIREWRCFMCNQSFTRKNSLIYHISVHLNVSRYQCPHCPGSKAFRHAEHFRSHLTTDHNLTRAAIKAVMESFQSKSDENLLINVVAHANETYSIDPFHGLEKVKVEEDEEMVDQENLIPETILEIGQNKRKRSLSPRPSTSNAPLADITNLGAAPKKRGRPAKRIKTEGATAAQNNPANVVFLLPDDREVVRVRAGTNSSPPAAPAKAPPLPSHPLPKDQLLANLPLARPGPSTSGIGRNVVKVTTTSAPIKNVALPRMILKTPTNATLRKVSGSSAPPPPPPTTLIVTRGVFDARATPTLQGVTISPFRPNWPVKKEEEEEEKKKNDKKKPDTAK